MSQPPSFEPRRRGKRPSLEGAQEAGRNDDVRHAPARRSRDEDGTDARVRRATPRAQTPTRYTKQTRADEPTHRPQGPVRRSAFRDHAPQHSDYEADSIDRTRVQRTPGANAAVPAPSYLPRSQARPEPHYGPDEAAPHPQRPPQAPARKPRQRRRKSFGRRILGLLLVLLLVLGGWAGYLYAYGNGRLGKVDALSGAPNTPGTTYLIVGSDSREGEPTTTTTGARSDTIMLLHKPQSGPTALVSIPRDTLVTYPGTGSQGKINGTFAQGGAEYLVLTVESLTGLTIDTYIEIGMDGVRNLTDAVGGVELCLDYDVSDSKSGLEWTAGCHHSDGETALAFSRMRYSDPLGDIGRNQRQRQVVSAIIDKALSPATVINPITQRNIVGSAAGVLTVQESGSLVTVARAGLALRSAIGSGGLMGAPPIASLNHPGPGGSSAVLLAPEAEQFWIDLRDGNLTENSFADF